MIKIMNKNTPGLIEALRHDIANNGGLRALLTETDNGMRLLSAAILGSIGIIAWTITYMITGNNEIAQGAAIFTALAVVILAMALHVKSLHKNAEVRATKVWPNNIVTRTRLHLPRASMPEGQIPPEAQEWINSQMAEQYTERTLRRFSKL